MKNNTLRIISKTIDRMAAMPHLPQELVLLLGRAAICQAESVGGLTLNMPQPNPSGSPLCPPDRLPLDPVHVNALADQILASILDPGSDMSDPMIHAANTVKQALSTKDLNLESAWREGQARFMPDRQPPATLAAWADKTPETPAFLAFLTAAAAAPSLEAGASALAESAGLTPDHIHSKGTCPVCGSLPYMLELKGKEGQRFAHCACCRHTYRIRRLACACCNTDDADALKYFTTDQEPGFRVETCSLCNTYVKTIDFRPLDREAFAPLNDLESLSLDILAAKEGFERMAPSVWCI